MIGISEIAALAEKYRSTTDALKLLYAGGAVSVTIIDAGGIPCFVLPASPYVERVVADLTATANSIRDQLLAHGITIEEPASGPESPEPPDGHPGTEPAPPTPSPAVRLDG